MPRRTGRYRAAWLVVALVAALIAFMPLRVAMGFAGLRARGLTARAVQGSVWYGRVVDARFGDVGLGDLRAGVSPLYLLAGETRLWVRGGTVGGAVPIRGAVSSGGRGGGIVAMTGELPVGQVFQPLPITAIALDDATIRFRDGACQQASGRVQARLSGVLDAAPGLALPRMVGGAVRCDGGRLVLPMTSQSGTEAITLRVSGDGRYRAELALQPGDPAIAEKLRMAGFVAGPRGYLLSTEGRF